MARVERDSEIKNERGFGRSLEGVFSQGTIASALYGIFSSTIITVAPMIVVLVAILIMEYLLGFSKLLYGSREIFTETVLYHFIFSFLFTSTFNAVLSKYMSDQIYMEKIEKIWSSYYVGILLNMILCAVVGIPFCIREYFVGHVAMDIVIITYISFIGLSLVLYNMVYLTIVKDYKKIALFYFIGMAVTVLTALLLVWVFKLDEVRGMLYALFVGYVTISSLEYAILRQYFKTASPEYKDVFVHIGKHMKHILANTFYTLGLYASNFVFWTTDMRKIVVNTFVSCDPYDMASFLALITNITATMIFVVRVELYFRGRYRDYSESIIGGRGRDIQRAKKRMFRTLSSELVYLARTQFIISVIMFLLIMVILPRFGFSGIIMQIYPCLAAGFFEIFTVYASLVFMYYFDDLTGAMVTSGLLMLVTLGVSLLATHLPVIWYGLGPVVGGIVAWTFAYFRLRWIERNIDIFTFCTGSILATNKGRPKDALVYDVRKGGLIDKPDKKEAEAH